MTPEIIITVALFAVIVGVTFGIQIILVFAMVLIHLIRFLALAIAKVVCLILWCVWWMRDRDAAMRSWKAAA